MCGIGVIGKDRLEKAESIYLTRRIINIYISEAHISSFSNETTHGKHQV